MVIKLYSCSCYSACYSTTSLPLNMNLTLLIHDDSVQKRFCDTTFPSLASHRNASSLLTCCPNYRIHNVRDLFKFCSTLTSPTHAYYFCHIINNSWHCNSWQNTLDIFVNIFLGFCSPGRVCSLSSTSVTHHIHLITVCILRTHHN